MIFLALACLLPNFLPIQLISSQTDKLIFLLFWTSFLQCLWLVVLTSCQRQTSERFSIISSQDGVDLGWLLIGENQPLKDVNTTTKIDDSTKTNTNMGRAKLVSGSGVLVPSWLVEQIDQYVSTVATIQYLIEPILGNCDRLDTNIDQKPLWIKTYKGQKKSIFRGDRTETWWLSKDVTQTYWNFWLDQRKTSKALYQISFIY